MPIPRELQKIEEKEITEKLKRTVFRSFDQNNMVLEIAYKKLFKIERTFTNNIKGIEEMEKTMLEFDSEEKVSKYFGGR